MQLKQNDYRVDVAATGHEGYSMATNSKYDAIVLDMGLPDMRGTAVCKDIRADGVMAPILILSGDSQKDTIITGLEAGADDYLIKPFYQDELKARLSALIRRDQRVFPAQQLNYQDFVLNTNENTLQYEGQAVPLTSLETAVLRCLIQRAPEVVPREYFFEHVWGINDEHASNRLDVYIRRVRHKLRKLQEPITIHTVHSKGYRLGE